jgi:short-subunit dehydrogenase
MQSSSSNPSILLLSSVAAVIPAPTRALYAATKSASLLFFQSLAIEHPKIAFSLILPGTIEGSFRTNAIDLSPSTATHVLAEITSPPNDTLARAEKPSNSNPLAAKLTRDAVARRCISAVDHGDRTVWMPGWYRYAHALYWIAPWVIERGAKKKYK